MANTQFLADEHTFHRFSAGFLFWKAQRGGAPRRLPSVRKFWVGGALIMQTVVYQRASGLSRVESTGYLDILRDPSQNIQAPLGG